LHSLVSQGERSSWLNELLWRRLLKSTLPGPFFPLNGNSASIKNNYQQFHQFLVANFVVKGKKTISLHLRLIKGVCIAKNGFKISN
jgi:hypothetical protein